MLDGLEIESVYKSLLISDSSFTQIGPVQKIELKA